MVETKIEKNWCCNRKYVITNGSCGGPIRSVYNMTKFGIRDWTKGMAIDLAKYNIRVNSIAPTFVVTPMTKKFLKRKLLEKKF